MKYDEEQIITALFQKSISGSKGVEAIRFRADHPKYLDLLDELENRQYIQNIDGYYYVRLVPLLDLRKRNNEAKHLLWMCELLFRLLRNFYRESPGQPLDLNSLAKLADLPRVDVNKALKYMIQGQIFGGYTTRFFAVEDANVTPGERILRFNSFEDVVEDIRQMQRAAKNTDSNPLEEAHPSNDHQYIDHARIDEIRNLNAVEFDFTRLVKICEEINACAGTGCHMALGALIRILLDHIPPIFGCTSFRQAAAQFSGGKSIKNTFEHLEKSSRNISDGLIHQQIRKKESIPNSNQVNFSPDLDVLLGEIIRVTREKEP